MSWNARPRAIGEFVRLRRVDAPPESPYPQAAQAHGRGDAVAVRREIVTRPADEGGLARLAGAGLGVQVGAHAPDDVFEGRRGRAGTDGRRARRRATWAIRRAGAVEHALRVVPECIETFDAGLDAARGVDRVVGGAHPRVQREDRGALRLGGDSQAVVEIARAPADDLPACVEGVLEFAWISGPGGGSLACVHRGGRVVFHGGYGTTRTRPVRRARPFSPCSVGACARALRTRSARPRGGRTIPPAPKSQTTPPISRPSRARERGALLVQRATSSRRAGGGP